MDRRRPGWSAAIVLATLAPVACAEEPPPASAGPAVTSSASSSADDLVEPDIDPPVPAGEIETTPGVEPDPAPDPDAGVVLAQDFDGARPGPLDPGGLAALFAEPPWSTGVDEGRVSVVTGAAAWRGGALEVFYPEAGVGPRDGGAQWRVELPAAYADLYVAYRVRFEPGFDFVRGGKLPGLVGGTANTGGDRPDGSDGWSARLMWTEGGEVAQYVYHPDQEGDTGDLFAWELGADGPRRFRPGAWHRVEHRIVMNTPGVADGVIEGWFDGELALRHEGIRFRTVDDLAIDALYFSTFFGGSDPSWAPTRDGRVWFDEIVVSTRPIGS